MSKKQCFCDTDKVALDGQCLSPQAANEYCGKGFHYENNGCVPTRCAPNEELDLATGGCVPRQKMNEVANNMGVQVGEGQKLGCPPGNKLVVEGNSAACVPDSQTCAPDETWNGQACAKTAQCPTGQACDPALGKCVAFAPDRRLGSDDGGRAPVGRGQLRPGRRPGQQQVLRLLRQESPGASAWARAVGHDSRGHHHELPRGDDRGGCDADALPRSPPTAAECPRRAPRRCRAPHRTCSPRCS